MEDDLQRTLIFVLTVVGIFIFFSVLLIRIELMASQTEAKINLLSAQMDWDHYLTRKAVQSSLRGSINE